MGPDHGEDRPDWRFQRATESPQRKEHAMPMPVQVEYTAHIWQEGDQFVAHAMPLDVISSGADPEATRKALLEAVELFLTTAREIGTPHAASLLRYPSA